LEKAEYQEEVRQNYHQLVTMDIGGKIESVDASGEEKELTQTLTTIILKFLRDFQTTN
jgi:thymidylate kinase